MAVYCQIEFRPAYDVPVWVRYPRLYWCSVAHATEWLSLLKQRAPSLSHLPPTLYVVDNKDPLMPGDGKAAHLIELLLRCRRYPMKIHTTMYPNEII